MHGFSSPPWTLGGGRVCQLGKVGGPLGSPRAGLLGVSRSRANEGPPSVREGAKRGGGRRFEVCLLGSSRVASAL